MKIFQSFYLTHFTKPASHRAIYRHIQSEHPRKVLEIGIQRAERTRTMLQMLIKYCGEKSDVHYCCIDPFEARTPNDGPGLSLRKTHRFISQFGIKSRLIPGTPHSAVRQLHLNRLIVKVDLAIFAMPDMQWLPPCMASLRELIHESAGIFVGIPIPESNGMYEFVKIDFSELEFMAAHEGQLPGHIRHAA
ncbi:MAG: hypothetical protein FWD31_06475 [Planctomycetaceae bacterium]|nr:hypothetical protein [Planctomycetaceae bacterium]